MAQVDLAVAHERMLFGLTAVNASRRQLFGVLSWRALVDEAAAAAGRAQGTAGLTVPEPDGGPGYTHAGWRDTCQLVIAALRLQQAAAEAAVLEHEDQAREARRAAAACRREASRASRDGDGRAAAASEAEAAHLDKAARQHQMLADASGVWAQAAAAARAHGERLVADEDGRALPIAAAIEAGGGLAQFVPGKDHHVRGWVPARALTGRAA